MNDNVAKRRRRRKDGSEDDQNNYNKGSGGGGNNETSSENKEGNKTKGIKEIITSLLLFEEQEKCESEEWSKTHQDEKLLFEDNHKKKTKVMLDYFKKFQGSYHDLDQNDGLRRKRKSRATSAAVTAAAEIGSDPGGAAEGGGQQQRRLWKKIRSQALVG
ncbi:hypothetical protein Acr_11g0010390 [Actinidia rufa]|uniref:Uncharacterized protein n=1 Tax=Actinidia rufa TaxID=165716 RepID=A0A7J0FDS0_9ERIC|nr:hypothetical protein Acr_11g0010390 [Actinidia rufa]